MHHKRPKANIHAQIVHKNHHVRCSSRCALSHFGMRRFGDVVRKLRNKRHLTQEELAHKSGLSRNTIIDAEKMRTPAVRGTTYRLLAEALGLTPEQLDHEWQERPIAQNRGDPEGGIPIINHVRAGKLQEFTHLEMEPGIADDYLPRTGTGVSDPNAFALRIVGTSMEPHYHEGDTVIFSPSAKHSDGMPALVQLGGERDFENTFKRVFDKGDHVMLVADNPAFRPQHELIPKPDIIRMSRAVRRVSDAI